MIIKRVIVGLLFLFVLGNVARGQEINTSYFLSNLPQQFRLNPSYQPEYKVFIGLPGLSGISVNYLNNSFHVEDLLRKRQDSVYLDVNRLYKSLRKRNFIGVSNENSIFSFGVKVNSWYATLDIAQKNDFIFRFNKDLFTFIKNGNADYLGRTMDFGKLGLNANMYTEFALGLSKKVNDKLTIGGRVKYLMGIANVKMTDSDLGVETAANGEYMNLYSRQNIRVSAPVKIDYKTQDGYVDWDSFDVDTDDITVSSILNSKNPGFGLDLGGEYKFNDKIKFYASLTDLGFIRWGGNNYNFHQDATFKWEGVDVSNSINKNDPNYRDMDDAFDDLLDSLKDNFRLKDNAGAYTTMLNPKLYLGATYEIGKLLNVGGLFKATLQDGLFYPALTASANARLLRNVSASLSYTVMPGNYANIGAGLTAKLGPFQLYVVTDNVLAANYTRTQTVNARFGINLLFGHKDRKRKVKDEPKPEIIVAPIIIPVKKDTVRKDSLFLPEPEVAEEVMKQERILTTDGDSIRSCYVIVGSFKSRQRAEILKNKLFQMGFKESEILRNETGMYRVALGAFPDRQACWDEVYRIREQFPKFSDAWGLITG